LKTFAQPREFVEHGSYARDREEVMSALDPTSIDVPILDIVQGFAELPHCFTLQSCFGHFMWDGQPDPRSVEPVPAWDVGSVRYNIAYLALCIEHSTAGARLRESLREIRTVDPEYVQFGSPRWFWERYPNCYALQVEPERFQSHDRALMPHSEALRVQAVRGGFFARLREIVAAEQREIAAE
jgi:hypothetical protein